MERHVVALDFDGVVCNSAIECMFTAYVAYARAKGADVDPRLESIRESTRRQFFSMRPFIRDGKDYLLILYFIEKGIEINTQSGFDRESAERMADACQSMGAGGSAELERLFQDTRRELRSRDEAAWLARNPPYDGVARGLAACRDQLDSVYVVTGKPTDAVIHILTHHGVALPADQILSSGDLPEQPAKNLHLEAVSRAARVHPGQIHFVDDQVAHLKAALGLGVRCYVAEWGYITEQQLREAADAGVPRLREDEFPEWLQTMTE